MLLRRAFFAFALLLWPLQVANPAGAATLPPPLDPALSTAIDGGITEVEVTIDLGSVGLSAIPFLGATLDTTGENPVFAFPITGGAVLDSDPAVALIEHEGSGLSLFDGAQSVTVGNFLIDTAGASVFADVIGTEDTLKLFEFGGLTDLGIELLIAEDLAGALTGIFGAPDLEGGLFGLARTDPQLAAPGVIPLPAAGWMLLGALGGLVALKRRKAA
ncbi:MAG: VPLPA-CTERM sorting domain-containing protein [Pseudomonadota bacterium]